LPLCEQIRKRAFEKEEIKAYGRSRKNYFKPGPENGKIKSFPTQKKE
jgi:hypothetical protein